jgi:hypothetical protein
MLSKPNRHHVEQTLTMIHCLCFSWLSPGSQGLQNSGFIYPQGDCRGVVPWYCGSSVTAQNSGYGWFPPAAIGWETIHSVPDNPPPLQAEEEETPT